MTKTNLDVGASDPVLEFAKLLKTADTSKMHLRQNTLRLRCSRFIALCALGTFTAATATSQQSNDRLKLRFANPPQEARPRVWWHWMSGNVSQEGADLDLAWMERIGIGGVHTFSGSIDEPAVIVPPVSFMSSKWQEVFHSTTREARKAGLEVTIAGSPGWSETGGTWVRPEDAMKKYVWSETQVEGGGVRGRLPTPPSDTGPFQGYKLVFKGSRPSDLTHDVYVDTAVVAYRTPNADLAQRPASYSSSSEKVDVSQLVSGIQDVPIILTANPSEQGIWLQAAYEQPTTIAAVTLGLASRAAVDVQVSDDGESFRTVLHAAADMVERPEPEQTLSFTAVRCRWVRVLFHPESAPTLPGLPKAYLASIPKVTDVRLTRIAFHTGGRVNRFEAKAGFVATGEFENAATPAVNAESVIDPDGVLNLTRRLRPDGTLDWSPPPGRWTILRIGYSLTGQTNEPAEAAATGLEVDKLDASMVRPYLEHYLNLYSHATGGQLGETGVQNLLTDSWEAGVQNWTPSMLTQFKQYRGYDPVPYLPVLAGRIVHDSEASDRFLWDFRQTLKEMLAENHYGTLHKVLQEHGMGYYTEAEGDTPRAIGDGMMMKSRADIPTGEFWYRNFATDEGQPPLVADLEEAASTAHVYGKPFAAAESLTVAAFSDPWAFSPAMLKPVVDEIFAHGINRILLHESHHQPFVNKKPGLEMAFFGQYFNRNDTWAEQAKSWVDYIARSSYLLQQGLYVADVAYFYGEDRNLTEIFQHRFNTDVPAGYHYDYINQETLLKTLSVKDGKLVTPSGMSYRVLFLPAFVNHFTLPTLRKIAELVSAGAVIVGPRPVGGLGILDDDQTVRAIADEVWGTSAAGITFHHFGKGKVYADTDLLNALRAEGVNPDVKITTPVPGMKILTLHRHTKDADIYFLSNQLDRPEDVTVTCRVHGMEPEAWHAEDGSSEPVSYLNVVSGISVPLHLHPQQSLFLIFKKSTVSSRSLPKVTTKVIQTLDGSWSIAFQPELGAPEATTFASLAPWTESSVAGIKYFSGHATYTRTFEAADFWFREGQRIFLNLGEVREIAEITVNGSPAQTVWHAPYSLDITDKIKPGRNVLAITVTNLWPNRLIGDQQPGATKYTFAPQSPYKADSPLLRSGLIGPVQVLMQDH